MGIPLPTTTITVNRTTLAQNVDTETDTLPTSVVASGVRAHVSAPSASSRFLGYAAEEVAGFRLDADTVDLRIGDEVVDEKTGEHYLTLWARNVPGLGMDHVEAGLRQTTGQVG